MSGKQKSNLVPGLGTRAARQLRPHQFVLPTLGNKSSPFSLGCRTIMFRTIRGTWEKVVFLLEVLGKSCH